MPENTRVYQKSLHSTTNFKKAPEITRRAIDLQKVPQITKNYKEVPESTRSETKSDSRSEIRNETKTETRSDTRSDRGDRADISNVGNGTGGRMDPSKVI